MTDLRKLADGIHRALLVREFGGVHEIDVIERILREHHEELRAELLAEWAALGGHDGEWVATMIRVLEGGEQADAVRSAHEGGGSGSSRSPSVPATPDPHGYRCRLCGSENVEATEGHEWLRCHHCPPKWGRPEEFDRPASDPIHQTNEVSDEPQVTNYDAEAEARAQEGAYVRPGDEVREVETEIVYKVVGLTFKRDDCVWCEDSDGSISWFWFSELRTLDGRPVAGFRERPCECCDAMAKACEELEDDKEYNANLCREKDLRIAELERELARVQANWQMRVDVCAQLVHERDEARAERDELLHAMPKSVMRRIKAQGWVRLDDATIERVVKRYDKCVESAVGYLTDEDLSRTRIIESVLRDLRDGKLKEGE